MTFWGFKWYGWLAILAVLVIAIPFKVMFMKEWGKRRREKAEEQRKKWGDGE